MTYLIHISVSLNTFLRSLVPFSPLPSFYRTYRNRVEELKRKKMELVASSKEKKNFEVSGSKTEQDNMSSEDEDYESFAVDWRAQHL